MKIKSLVFLIILLVSSQVAFSQDNPMYEFCEIHIFKKPNGKVSIAIDDGTKPYSTLGDNFLKDNAGEKKEFMSPMACLSYMESLGWEYVESFKPSTSGLLVPIISVIFRRPLKPSGN